MAVVNRPAASNQLILTDTTSTDYVADWLHYAWVRWCHASINKHFEGYKRNYTMYIEGDERITQDESEFAELRIDGPFILIAHKNCYFLDIEINVLCQAHMDPKELYNIQRVIGTFTRGFTNTIPVYKYGDEEIDDDTLLGCLHLRTNTDERIDINYFGIVRPDTRLTQASIEGHYRLELPQ